VSQAGKLAFAVCALLVPTHAAWGQSAPANPQNSPSAQESQQAQQTTQSGGTQQQAGAQGADSGAQQTTHGILDVFTSYRDVRPHQRVSPMTVSDKFILSVRDTFDYGSVLSAGFSAGFGQAIRADPEYGDGMAAYGRYLWRAYVNEGVGNFFTEGALPSLMHQDPRYYSIGKGGGFKHRLAYAITRAVITKTDSGGTTFNCAEVLGSGMEGGVAVAYSPAQDRTVGRAFETWGARIGSDALANVANEFWPDVHRKLFHR
jgi:hypothetical protein